MKECFNELFSVDPDLSNFATYYESDYIRTIDHFYKYMIMEPQPDTEEYDTLQITPDGHIFEIYRGNQLKGAQQKEDINEINF